jgi:putative phage-type endonuclease
MGENPWKTRAELLLEKRGPAHDSYKNTAMSRGTLLEPQARAAYIARTGKSVTPGCLESNQYTWLRASVDGISSNGDSIVEIKCGEVVYRKTSEEGCPPAYYYGQLQHILAVSGLASIDFWCYLPDCPELLIQVDRDDEYITSLLAAEKDFWGAVQRRKGLLGWIFGIGGTTRHRAAEPCAASTNSEPKTYEEGGRGIFLGTIEGLSVRAEVPIESKHRCDQLLRKPELSREEAEYLHDNYWVTVYYKGDRHGYHGVSDIWTYSARDLPELTSLHDWMYLILGKKKADITMAILTSNVWEEGGTIRALGGCNSFAVELSFRPKGHVLSFVLKDSLRWKDKCTYNTKTGRSDFPYYYSSVQSKIVDWAVHVFQENKVE